MTNAWICWRISCEPPRFCGRLYPHIPGIIPPWSWLVVLIYTDMKHLHICCCCSVWYIQVGPGWAYSSVQNTPPAGKPVTIYLLKSTRHKLVGLNRQHFRYISALHYFWWMLTEQAGTYTSCEGTLDISL